MNKLKKARWRNLLQKAAKINRLIKKGYMVFDHYGHISNGFKFDDGKLYEGNDYCRVIWVGKKDGWDNALNIPISKYNADRFDKWKAVHPKHFTKI